MPPMPPHTYEEIRDVVVNILLGIEGPPDVRQFETLKQSVNGVFAKRAGNTGPSQLVQGNPQDEELVRDVFWDLFRQGAITLGMNNSNPNWPFFRLSHFGQATLASQSPWRFHDSSSYLAMLVREVPDISSQAITYADEAVQSFYAQCLLASTVMLGVAAEAEFIQLVAGAASRPKLGHLFSVAAKEQYMLQKIDKFLPALRKVAKQLDRRSTENLDTNFAFIQSVLRNARNDAGHPTSVTPNRENVYVNLQLFVPFARQLMLLRQSLLALDP